MILFPAIDILGGRAVRLLKGEYNKVTDYGDPLVFAEKWISQGAEFLHLVDLDGARTAGGINIDVIKDIASSFKIPVQTGGGVRTLFDIEKRLESGVKRVILGTAAVKDKNFVKDAVKKFGTESIVLGVDAKNGKVAVSGWEEESNLDALDFTLMMKDNGVKYVVFTDISRDGALTGVNVSATKRISDLSGLNVIASGGVSSLKDLTELKTNNLYGAILGRSIYENVFSLKDAIDTVNKAKTV